MRLDFMTPDVWNGLVLAVIIIGLALAALRLYADFSRPHDDDERKPPPPSDTRKPLPRSKKSQRSSRRR